MLRSAFQKKKIYSRAVIKVDDPIYCASKRWMATVCYRSPPKNRHQQLLLVLLTRTHSHSHTHAHTHTPARASNPQAQTRARNLAFRVSPICFRLSVFFFNCRNSFVSLNHYCLFADLFSREPLSTCSMCACVGMHIIHVLCILFFLFLFSSSSLSTVVIMRQRTQNPRQKQTYVRTQTYRAPLILSSCCRFNSINSGIFLVLFSVLIRFPFRVQ